MPNKSERMRIRFGTDGWRGVIAEDFTFERVRAAAASLADMLAGATEPVIVGFDRRFLSKDFARAVAETLAGAGLSVRIANEYVPTPAISMAVRDSKAAAGVIITASHNPARWNGFKVKETVGTSARSEFTAKLESAIAERLESKRPLPRLPWDSATRTGKIEEVDFGAPYAKALKTKVDLTRIVRQGWRVVVDPIHGAGSGYLAKVLRDAGVMVREIRADANPCFGGVNPEPIAENLGMLRAELLEAKAPAIGLALDGDADRIGAYDENGEFFDSHRIFACVLRHLLDVRRMPGKVAQTVSSTVMVRRLAEKRAIDVVETPIGFKYVAEQMLAGGVLMGGEESGGLGFDFHLPDRDGSFSGLLLLEACAYAGLPPRALLEKVFDETGEWHYDRVDVHLDSARRDDIVARTRALEPEEVAGFRVASRNTRDGNKLIFDDDSWLLLRASGTEPVLRIYAEAQTPEAVTKLLAAGRALAE